jgi:hypothetical protein
MLPPACPRLRLTTMADPVVSTCLPAALAFLGED